MSLTDVNAFVGSLANMVREPIVCKDGATVSVQAGRWHYSLPRADAPFFSHVEAGYPTGFVPLTWRAYAENKKNLNGSIFAYIPFKLVEDYIEIHGGIISGELPPRWKDHEKNAKQ